MKTAKDFNLKEEVYAILHYRKKNEYRIRKGTVIRRQFKQNKVKVAVNIPYPPYSVYAKSTIDFVFHPSLIYKSYDEAALILSLKGIVPK